MTDQNNPDAVAGHNNPPPYNEDQVKSLFKKAEDTANAASKWLDAGEITTEADAGKAKDFLDGARKIFKEIEDKRKEAKAPYMQASREIDDVYKPLTGLVENASVKVKAILTAFISKAEAEERARREAEARKAREEIAAAEKARIEAERRNDLIAQQESEARAKAAEKAKAAAEKEVHVKVDSASGGGQKRTGLRTKRTAKIKNIKTAFVALQDEPEIAEAILRVANQKIRSAKGEIDIPGIEIIVEKTV